MVNRRDVFQAIADPTRRAILKIVSVNGSMNPGTIANQFQTSRQTISNHIQILMECELLTSQQRGREIIYYFNPSKMKEVDDFLQPFKAQWEAKFEKMDEMLNKIQ